MFEASEIGHVELPSLGVCFKPCATQASCHCHGFVHSSCSISERTVHKSQHQDLGPQDCLCCDSWKLSKMTRNRKKVWVCVSGHVTQKVTLVTKARFENSNSTRAEATFIDDASADWKSVLLDWADYWTPHWICDLLQMLHPGQQASVATCDVLVNAAFPVDLASHLAPTQTSGDTGQMQSTQHARKHLTLSGVLEVGELEVANLALRGLAPAKTKWKCCVS